MATPAYRLDSRAVTRDAFYAAACDPRRHVVVEACAGAGKTWMLVARIVRALVDGAAPQEILAITFTRKAAGEMRTRLADWLRECAALDVPAAAARLMSFGVPPAQAQAQAAALIGLHERILASGRAVEVCTIHAWYAQLLQAAPLELLAELGLAPGTTLLEDPRELADETMRAFHGALLHANALHADYRRLAVRHGRSTLARWFEVSLDRRAEIELAREAGVLDGSVEPAAEAQPAARVREPTFVAQVQSLMRGLGARDKHRNAALGAIDALSAALDLPEADAACDALRAALFTDSGPRKQLGNLPEQAWLCGALDAIEAERAQALAHDDHVSMARLTGELFAQYQQCKARRARVDMVDLERLAQRLLGDPLLAGHVQERLDARVRHLLVDEFQDTSPLQWSALHGWLAAYAGAGGGREAPRLFIVGDPKQSIYRFRRAEPRVFAAAQDFVAHALDGTLAACDHTRRCAPGVVDVVNRVFDGWLAGFRPHTTDVVEAPAQPALQALPAVPRAARADAADALLQSALWRPSLTQPRHEPQAVIRAAEAKAVAQAVQALVHGEGVAPGRILVLARRRVVLADAADALAALGLPHVASEELRLADLPEVQDLLALLDVLASPGQSLALARALRSPLFGASDADLLALAQAAQGGPWLKALLGAQRPASPALERAAVLLRGWQAVADTLPPHDLLDRIVHEGALLQRLAAAVPAARDARAAEAVRALLAAALELDGGRYLSIYGFVRALRNRRIEMPPAQTRDAVRLLTIHGAKGLEADIVLLMDTEPVPPPADRATLLVDWPVDADRPRRVAFVVTEARGGPALDALRQHEQAAREREEANALYVALTRARQRVIASRTPPARALAAPSWWARLEALAAPWQAPAVPAGGAAERPASVVALPLGSRALDRAPDPAHDADDALARLGQAVHRMLEWAARDPAAERAALARAAALAFERADAVADVLAIGSRILDSAACRAFFEPDTVAWAGNEWPVATAAGEVRRIDRLLKLRDGTWWVLDYKLAGQPHTVPALRAQLAGYRAAVAALVPGEPVRAGFVTAAGALIEPEPQP